MHRNLPNKTLKLENLLRCHNNLSTNDSNDTSHNDMLHKMLLRVKLQCFLLFSFDIVVAQCPPQLVWSTDSSLQVVRPTNKGRYLVPNHGKLMAY